MEVVGGHLQRGAPGGGVEGEAKFTTSKCYMTHLDGMFVNCFIHMAAQEGKSVPEKGGKRTSKCDGKQPQAGQSDFVAAFSVSW